MEKRKLTKLYRELTKKRRELFEYVRKEEAKLNSWFIEELKKLREK